MSGCVSPVCSVASASVVLRGAAPCALGPDSSPGW